MSALKSFLLVADTTQVTLDELVAEIDRDDAVSNWHVMLPGTLALVSDLDVGALSDHIRGRWPDLRFLVSELVPGRKAGWLPERVWDFMNQPKAVERA